MVTRDKKYFELYQKYRYNHQLNWYKGRTSEFKKALRQAKGCGVTLMAIAALGSFFASASFIGPWRLPCLIIAAIFPVLYTTLTAYSALYAFDQQAKLFQDTITALDEVRANSPDLRQGLSEQEYALQLHDYVDKVENIFLVEQGQWGQLAGRMRPPAV